MIQRPINDRELTALHFLRGNIASPQVEEVIGKIITSVFKRKGTNPPKWYQENYAPKRRKRGPRHASACARLRRCILTGEVHDPEVWAKNFLSLYPDCKADGSGIAGSLRREFGQELIDDRFRAALKTDPALEALTKNAAEIVRLERIIDDWKAKWKRHKDWLLNRDSTLLRELQTQLPWTIRYSQDFRANPQPHKDFSHALTHVLKAAGHLAELVDEMDHDRTWAENPGIRAQSRYVADLVVCALRMANTMPGGPFDLQSAVEDRIRTKNATPGSA